MRNVASRSRNGRGESVVMACGRRRSSCGYCRSSGPSSISHGLWAQSLTVDDYQDLLDRGWRRSGCFLYKPEMERTCCPAYTIRLKASDFVPSKEQLRVSKRMQRLLDGTLEAKRIDVLGDPNASKKPKGSVRHEYLSPAPEKSISARNNEQNEDKKVLHYLSEQINNVVHIFTEKEQLPSGIQLPKASVKKVSQVKRKLLVNGSEDLLYSSNIAFQIAASISHVQSDDKDAHQSKPSKDCSETNRSSPKTIAEKLAISLDPVLENSSLSARACNGHINFYLPNEQVSLSKSVQNAAVPKKSAANHGSGENCSNSSEHCQVKRRRLEIHLKKSSFDPEEYALYMRYQLIVHNDKPEHVSENSYRRFLVDTPLFHVPPTGDGTVPPCGFGSFHQQYVIDGQLVAVGVIDILPRCLSSKYLFWDPDFAFLSLGKYSAIQEINWVKENQVYCPSLQYYYLGYYIHSCSKMRYKAAYRPSELLCPLRYQWVPFDIAKPLLDQKPYAVLSDSSILENGELSSLHASEDAMEGQHDDIGQEDANGVPVYDVEEMEDDEWESSDDESGPGSPSYGETDDDVSNILLGLRESQLRYKDLRIVCGSNQQRYLEAHLRRYTRVVGSELSERMVYSLTGLI